MGAHTRGTLWREGKERGAGNWAGRYFRILYSSSCRMLLHPYTQAVWLSPGNTRNLTCRLWDIPQTLESCCCVVRRRRKVDFLYGWRARNARHQPNNIDIPDILFRRERTQYNKKEQLFFFAAAAATFLCSSFFTWSDRIPIVWSDANELLNYLFVCWMICEAGRELASRLSKAHLKASPYRRRLGRCSEATAAHNWRVFDTNRSIGGGNVFTKINAARRWRRRDWCTAMSRMRKSTVCVGIPQFLT